MEQGLNGRECLAFKAVNQMGFAIVKEGVSEKGVSLDNATSTSMTKGEKKQETTA